MSKLSKRSRRKRRNRLRSLIEAEYEKRNLNEEKTNEKKFWLNCIEAERENYVM